LQARLIDDLLDVSRILVGKLSLDVQRLELAAVVDAAVEACRPAAESKGVHLKMAPAPRPLAVRGDAARLRQVVSNLVGNAIKFTPAGGSVGVSVERVGKSARIRVTDTGEGIKPEALPHIFERFWQAHQGQADPAGGFGLGLTIVRQLVELHAGTVEAQSDGEGRGARFTVELPITMEAPTPEYDALLKR
jgi:signal transduction histidine kinase